MQLSDLKIIVTGAAGGIVFGDVGDDALEVGAHVRGVLRDHDAAGRRTDHAAAEAEGHRPSSSRSSIVTEIIRDNVSPMIVEGLFCYPIKSFRGLELGELELLPQGPRWDREFMLVDENNRFITQRTHPQLARIALRVAGQNAIELSLRERGSVHFSVEERLPPGLTFGMLLNLASVSNAEDAAVLWAFVGRYAPGTTPETTPRLAALIAHAIAYYKTFVRPTRSYRAPTEQERAAFLELRQWLAGPGAAAAGSAGGASISCAWLRR